MASQQLGVGWVIQYRERERKGERERERERRRRKEENGREQVGQVYSERTKPIICEG